MGGTGTCEREGGPWSASVGFLGGCCSEKKKASIAPRTPPLRTHSSYCTKKLRRLYRNLKLTHGRGKYQKRPVDAATATEDG
jgi:hypothetical protein